MANKHLISSLRELSAHVFNHGKACKAGTLNLKCVQQLETQMSSVRVRFLSSPTFLTVGGLDLESNLGSGKAELGNLTFDLNQDYQVFPASSFYFRTFQIGAINTL
jgi:hypothetical protein